MAEILNLFIDAILDALRAFGYFIKCNLRYMANVFEFILPYMMFSVGLSMDEFWVEELLIPIAMFTSIYLLRYSAERLGVGNKIPPIPNKRFTQVDDDGEVSIENSRLQELILYMADLEDWMERKNVL